MYASREVLTAALSRAWGAGFQIEALATETLARARIEGLVEPDPTKLGTRLGYSLDADERLDCRARILRKPRRFRRGCIRYLWTAEEWGINAFLGCAMAVLDERGYSWVSDTDPNVLHLAGLLALPGLGRNDPTTAKFVVGWFVDAYQRGRSASSNNSGLRIAAK